MTKKECVELLESSKSEEEWIENTAKIKEAFEGKYPPFWRSSIIFGDVLYNTKSNWEYVPPSTQDRKIVTDLTGGKPVTLENIAISIKKDKR